MSAIFRAEIVSLMRLVASQENGRQIEQAERELARSKQSSRNAADRQAIIDTLAAASRCMTSTEISQRAGVSRQRVDRMLEALLAEKIVTRRRRATRRADGEGFRNPYKYRMGRAIDCSHGNSTSITETLK